MYWSFCWESLIWKGVITPSAQNPVNKYIMHQAKIAFHLARIEFLWPAEALKGFQTEALLRKNWKTQWEECLVTNHALRCWVMASPKVGGFPPGSATACLPKRLATIALISSRCSCSCSGWLRNGWKLKHRQHRQSLSGVFSWLPCVPFPFTQKMFWKLSEKF